MQWNFLFVYFKEDQTSPKQSSILGRGDTFLPQTVVHPTLLHWFSRAYFSFRRFPTRVFIDCFSQLVCPRIREFIGCLLERGLSLVEVPTLKVQIAKIYKQTLVRIGIVFSFAFESLNILGFGLCVIASVIVR